MTVIINTASLLIASLMLSGAAHACAPPLIGDQFRYKNGPILEIVKTTVPTCETVKFCVRPVWSNQPCHWIKADHSNIPDATWIIIYGAKQDDDL
jgi:hypothetical protein